MENNKRHEPRPVSDKKLIPACVVFGSIIGSFLGLIFGQLYGFMPWLLVIGFSVGTFIGLVWGWSSDVKNQMKRFFVYAFPNQNFSSSKCPF